MTVTQNVDAAAAGRAPAPARRRRYLHAGIGTVTFEGNGYTHNDVAAWLDVAGQAEGLTSPTSPARPRSTIGDRGRR